MRTYLFLLAAAVFASEFAYAAPLPKVNICHLDKDTGKYELVNVNANSEAAHMAHGDALPGSTVGGTPLAANCGTVATAVKVDEFFVSAASPFSDNREVNSLPTAYMVVTSSVILETGKKYRIDVMGTADAGDNIQFDAKCSLSANIANATWSDDVTGYSSYGPNLLDMYVNGVPGNWGTTCDPGHLYSMTLTGNGQAARFYINDVYPSNNTGYLGVNIYLLP